VIGSGTVSADAMSSGGTAPDVTYPGTFGGAEVIELEKLTLRLGLSERSFGSDRLKAARFGSLM
jgi:hypothetical protein